MGTIVDEWGYYNRYCTSWVAWSLFNKNGFNAQRYMGNAENWGAKARERGYAVDMYPGPGLGGVVGWWDGSKGMGEHGHVAWVESVIGENVIVLAYNVPNGSGAFSQRTIPKNSVTGIYTLRICRQHQPELAGAKQILTATGCPTCMP
jgi:surface antigen